jgi:Acyl-protein synthetase, LuxE
MNAASDRSRDGSDGLSPALAELFATAQFSIPQAVKEALLVDELKDLVSHHRSTCPPYRRITDALGDSWRIAESLADLPYLPVSLFKTHELFSVPRDDVFKVMTSSGTTGQAVSRVVLDRRTADLQSKALASVMSKVLGNQRMPMVIVDTPNVVKNRSMFSARGAGVLGMMPFGRRHFYALNDDMELDVAGLQDFLERHAGHPILLFGFTFMVWKYLLQAVLDSQLDIDLSLGTLIHSGGWKKLADEAVDNARFKSALSEATGLSRVHNFYGMVEQVGSVFLEGDDGFLYPPNFADVIVRDPQTWEQCPNGVPGVVEVLSVLPRSYPGHILLTEDLGVVHGVGDASGPWAGKQLEILGRVPRSELRGCSDTHAFDILVA